MQLNSFFFSVWIFFHRHWRFREQQGKGGKHLYSSLALPPVQETFATLHVRWLPSIFNHIACYYQTATRWYLQPWRIAILLTVFFSIQVFFHEHSRFTGQQEKGEAISLTTLYHFHLLHRCLDISRAITTGRSPLHIGSSRTRTGNLSFSSASC